MFGNKKVKGTGMSREFVLFPITENQEDNMSKNNRNIMPKDVFTERMKEIKEKHRIYDEALTQLINEMEEESGLPLNAVQCSNPDYNELLEALLFCSQDDDITPEEIYADYVAGKKLEQ